MPTVFKVNHKYTGNGGRHIWICLSIYEGYTWMVCLNATVVDADKKTPGFVYKISDIDHWVEFIEPRREFFNAYHKTSDDTFYGGPYRSRSDADQGSEVNRFGRYGVLELIHHSDTKVESVFHMVARK